MYLLRVKFQLDTIDFAVMMQLNNEYTVVLVLKSLKYVNNLLGHLYATCADSVFPSNF